MSSDEPQVVDRPEESRFVLLVDGVMAGEAEYERQGTALSVSHLEVDDEHEGRGLGSTLARGVLDAAREAGYSVLPHCPFTRSWIERHPDYVDLVPADQRERFGLTGD